VSAGPRARYEEAVNNCVCVCVCVCARGVPGAGRGGRSNGDTRASAL
jgi:hypothetical protein